MFPWRHKKSINTSNEDIEETTEKQETAHSIGVTTEKQETAQDIEVTKNKSGAAQDRPDTIQSLGHRKTVKSPLLSPR